MRTLIKISLPLPDITGMKLNDLLLVESIRQSQFDLITSYLESSYMRFKCTAIVTGDSYQSRSAISACSNTMLNASKIYTVVRAIGFEIDEIPADWRDGLNVE